MEASKRWFATLFLLCITGMIMAQDVIVKKDQSTVMSKVLEITNTEIKYKKWSNQDGPTYSISRTDVVSINYENGEVEVFSGNPNSQQNIYSQLYQKNNLGYLESYNTFPAGLKMNGRRLTNEEIKGLLDEQTYLLFNKAKNQINFGEIIGIVGLGSLFMSYLFAPTYHNDYSLEYIKPCIATLVFGIAAITPGIVLSIVGSNNNNKVVDTYNQNKSYSLNISPTLMRRELPQSQGNYGLGLTLNLNF